MMARRCLDVSSAWPCSWLATSRGSPPAGSRTLFRPGGSTGGVSPGAEETSGRKHVPSELGPCAVPICCRGCTGWARPLRAARVACTQVRVHRLEPSYCSVLDSLTNVTTNSWAGTAAEDGHGKALRVAAPPQLKAAGGHGGGHGGGLGRPPPAPPRERLLHQRRLVAGQDAVRVGRRRALRVRRRGARGSLRRQPAVSCGGGPARGWAGRRARPAAGGAETCTEACTREASGYRLAVLCLLCG